MAQLYERIAVARPADANGAGPVRARAPEQVDAIRRMCGGAHPAVVAEAFGVSARTVYRYLAEERLEERDVTVAGWTARFVVEPCSPPRRVSAWRRA